VRVKRYPALEQLRIGCVQYLNSRPLIHAYPGEVKLEHPSELARDIASGALDVGLVPIYEALARPGYVIADGVAIASHGPVHSVFLAYRGRLHGTQEIAVDPASLTSVNLLKVLVAEFHGLHPKFVPLEHFDSGPEALLLIGNQAIDFRAASQSDYTFLDLGEEWQRCTGLPFVYAVWLLREDLPHASAAADELRALKREGVLRIAELVAAEDQRHREFVARYLTQHIRFELGEPEKAGIAQFRELLEKHRFIGSLAEPLKFI
jgi:chorismate dehydratase